MKISKDTVQQGRILEKRCTSGNGGVLLRRRMPAVPPSARRKVQPPRGKKPSTSQAATRPADVPPSDTIWVANGRLKLRSKAHLDSTHTGYLEANVKVRVLEWQTSADGGQRACIALDGTSEVIGWCSTVKDGVHKLSPVLAQQQDLGLDPGAPAAASIVSDVEGNAGKPAFNHTSKVATKKSSARASQVFAEVAGVPDVAQVPLMAGALMAPPSSRADNGAGIASVVVSDGAEITSATVSKSIKKVAGKEVVSRAASPQPTGNAAKAAADEARRESAPAATDAPTASIKGAVNVARFGKKLLAASKTRAPALAASKTRAPALISALELLADAEELAERAKAAEAALLERGKSLRIKLGELLSNDPKQLSALCDAMTKGAAKGEITKMMWRKHVRSLMQWKDVTEIDELFKEFDADGGGSLDASELRAALKILRDEAKQNTEHVQVESPHTITLASQPHESQLEPQLPLTPHRQPPLTFHRQLPLIPHTGKSSVAGGQRRSGRAACERGEREGGRCGHRGCE